MTFPPDLRPIAAALLSLFADPLDEPMLVGTTPRADTTAQVVESLARELERSYVFEDKAAALARTLRDKAASGAWKALEGEALADALDAECQAALHDRHMRVRYEAGPAQRPASPFGRDPESARRAWVQRNYGYEKAERMQGNVGYLEVRGFPPEDVARETGAAALRFVQDTDALILDLRRNGGGEPGGVRYLCSWFFGEEPVLLNAIENRELGSREEFWTLRELPGRRYLEKPVFVLTGARTFSGGEECAYDLQTQKRATLVGCTTGGGAHPVDFRDLGQGFRAAIPVARAVNPVTGTNWEGVGVKPDVEVAEDAALDEAWALALEALAAREQDAERKAQLLELARERRGKSAR